MSIWFDKLGNKYAEAGNSGWLRAYTDKRLEQLSVIFTKHAEGKEKRHTGEMVDYTAGKTVTKALDEAAANVTKLQTTDTALKNDLKQLEANKANLKANTDGGFCAGTAADVTKGGCAAGKNASATAGGAAGQYAVTETGGSIGMASASKKGFSGGQNAVAVNGASGGMSAVTENGGAFGETAKSAAGFAGGQNSKTSDGAALGKDARCAAGTAASAAGIDAVQLGTGCNTAPKSMQVYGYPLLSADGTIPMARMQRLEDKLTEKIDELREILQNTGILTEELLTQAGMIFRALIAGIHISGGSAVPSMDAPAGSISLLGQDVDTSAYKTTTYPFQPGCDHTLTCCLRGTFLGDTAIAQELYITENPPDTNLVTWRNNSFILRLYQLKIYASGAASEGGYLFTYEEPFAVKRETLGKRDA